jgi:hypothetical protein
MSFSARVIADSISTLSRVRLITILATYPRIVHSEMMTHRVFGRNSASTRAIPVKDQLRNLLTNPFIPEKFGINQPGMQAWQHLAGLKHEEAVKVWLRGRDRAVTTVIELLLGLELAGQVLDYDTSVEGTYAPADVLLAKLDEVNALIPDSKSNIDLDETTLLNVHKQLAGRGLEAYMWHTVVITATEWDNFFGLRDHEDAQGEIATIARLMREAIEASSSRELKHGEYHLPFVKPDEFDNVEDAIKASAARCAATSYNRQTAKRDFDAEAKRYQMLVDGGHMSPLEHQATPFSDKEVSLRGMGIDTIRGEGFRMSFSDDEIENMVESLHFNGNLRGWNQHRKTIKHEGDFSKIVRGDILTA